MEYANYLELDISRFLQNMSDHVYLNQVNQDIESRLQSGVTFASALFINGVRYTARRNMKQIITAIVNTENKANYNQLGHR